MGSIEVGSMDTWGKNPLPSSERSFCGVQQEHLILDFQEFLNLPPPTLRWCSFAGAIILQWLCTSLLSPGLTSYTSHTCRCRPTMSRKGPDAFQLLAAASSKIWPLCFTKPQTRCVFQQKQSLNNERSIQCNPSGITGSPYPH